MDTVNPAMYFVNCIFKYGDYISGVLGEAGTLIAPPDMDMLIGKTFLYENGTYLITLHTNLGLEKWTPEVKKDAREAIDDMIHSFAEAIEKLYIDIIMGNSKEGSIRYTNITYDEAKSQFVIGFTSPADLAKDYLQSRLVEMKELKKLNPPYAEKEKIKKEITLINAMILTHNQVKEKGIAHVAEIMDILNAAKPLRFYIRLKR